jgi:uncharacterized membrane protein YdcZ (DUF606 family)
MFWLFGGPLLALFLLANAVQKSSGSLSWADVLYVVVVAAILAARRVDATKYGGVNAFGETSSPLELRRYTVVVAVVAGLLWLVVRVGGKLLN